jgi:hypothetical protein
MQNLIIPAKILEIVTSILKTMAHIRFAKCAKTVF